jgi:hypothetical protein
MRNQHHEVLYLHYQVPISSFPLPSTLVNGHNKFLPVSGRPPSSGSPKQPLTICRPCPTGNLLIDIILQYYGGLATGSPQIHGDVQNFRVCESYAVDNPGRPPIAAVVCSEFFADHPLSFFRSSHSFGSRNFIMKHLLSFISLIVLVACHSHSNLQQLKPRQDAPCPCDSNSQCPAGRLDAGSV